MWQTAQMVYKGAAVFASKWGWGKTIALAIVLSPFVGAVYVNWALIAAWAVLPRPALQVAVIAILSLASLAVFFGWAMILLARFTAVYEQFLAFQLILDRIRCNWLNLKIGEEIDGGKSLKEIREKMSGGMWGEAEYMIKNMKYDPWNRPVL